MPEPQRRLARVELNGFVLRSIDTAEAQAQCDRLRAIFRDAVVAAGPASYSADQVAAWAGSADDVERWATRFTDGATWIAASRDAPGRPIAFALRLPADHLDLLFVDPASHRRGLGGALLAAVADEAREAGIASLSADASLISYPLFLKTGYDLVAWEEVEHGGQMFRRAKMRQTLQ